MNNLKEDFFTLVHYTGGPLFTYDDAHKLALEFNVVVSAIDIQVTTTFLRGETKEERRIRERLEASRKEVLLILNGVFQSSKLEVKQKLRKALPLTQVRLEIVRESEVPGDFFFIGDHPDKSAW